MFISIQELKTHLCDYQIEQITDNDDTIVCSAIDTAVSEVKSYLANRYDVQAIFAASGSSRSAIVVEHVKVCAVYHLLLLANVDAIYERYEKAYERSVQYLKQVAGGLLSPDLPYLRAGASAPSTPIQLSSNKKFNHSF